MSACAAPSPRGSSAANVVAPSSAPSNHSGGSSATSFSRPPASRQSPKKAFGGTRQSSPATTGNEKKKGAAAAAAAPNKSGKLTTKLVEEAARRVATPDADAINRKAFRNAVGLYPDLEDPPEPVRFCRHGTHTAPQFQQAPNGLTVWNEKGYRLTKATHGVEEGTWYYELTIGERPKGNENLRVGWAQISADLQGPCGMDIFAYGYRMDPGAVFHQSRGREYGTGYAPGDVLGCMIHIPVLTTAQRKDLESRRWIVGEPYARFFRARLGKSADGGAACRRRSDSGKASKRRKKSNPLSAAAAGASSSEEVMPEEAEVTNKTGGEFDAPAPEAKEPTNATAEEEELGSPLESVKRSQIIFFKNGKCEDVAFDDIFLGKYHPAVSSYMGGKVVANFGPQFAFPPPAEWNGSRVLPMSESYGAGRVKTTTSGTGVVNGTR